MSNEEGIHYQCPMNLIYIDAENLSSLEIIELGYLPLWVKIRSHSNSKYGKQPNGKCATIWEPIEIPAKLIKGKKPSHIKLFNKNSWGFDNHHIKIPKGKRSLEKIMKHINKELNARVAELKRFVEDLFGFEMPKNAKIKKFDVYVTQLCLLHIATGKTLVWKRGTVHRKEKIKALLLHSINGHTMKKGKIFEKNLWEVGEDFATPEDKFCIIGEQQKTQMKTICGDEATFEK